ncbi:GNAT family N-acetyltransferase [Noviherbaspirillum massiliense]|uniref:GNAT family N-acetyltransferase n=1 Tax=Noviherbaspirillum massiliense TaxID=1465823 RepID=UPI00031BA5BF|nr:GNAT family N-acetyltransferase [Noviherbaspirillum massiliense]
MKSAKELYRDFSVQEESIPIFSRAWWLDATAGPENWDVALVVSGGQIKASMPYMMRRRFGLRVLSQPALTQTLGPWLRPLKESAGPAKKLSQDQELMDELIAQLPRFDYFNQNWHYSLTNWLPFSWRGFQQTTCYTYVINDLRDMGKVWAGFHNNVRRNCKTATERYRITIREDLPLNDYLALNRMTFQRQGMEVPYPDDYVRRLDAACEKQNCRKTYIAVDPQGRQHAGCYVVWDSNSAYGLMNGSDPALRGSGALSLCFWHAIQDVARVTRKFDFEGSMLKPVEHFVRRFGAIQTPYFNISKTHSRLLRARHALLATVRDR